jgi:hypothetical protein
MAAVRACGEEALHSRRAAAQVHAVLRPNAPGGKAPGGHERRRARHAQQARARFLRLPREEHGLPLPLDSYRFHNTPYTWEQERRREREAYARVDQFRRYAFGDVFENPARCSPDCACCSWPNVDAMYPIAPAEVTLTVADLDRAVGYYEDAIGLGVNARKDGTARMGVPGRDLVVLEEQPGARPGHGRTTGLFHLALLMPSRGALHARP